jgi:apolipoprotein N-acyltransferase
MRLPRGQFGVLICFEVIFPELCRKFVREGADFMVTITNDAWFGKTSAPYQHLAQATFRAIENRVWLVRAANTGISAFVDPWGRIRKSSDLFTPAVLSEEIKFKANAITFYTRYGDLFAICCSLLGMGLMGYVLLKKQVIWS